MGVGGWGLGFKAWCLALLNRGAPGHQLLATVTNDSDWPCMTRIGQYRLGLVTVCMAVAVTDSSRQVATLEAGDWFGGESAVQGGHVSHDPPPSPLPVYLADVTCRPSSLFRPASLAWPLSRPCTACLGPGPCDSDRRTPYAVPVQGKVPRADSPGQGLTPPTNCEGSPFPLPRRLPRA